MEIKTNLVMSSSIEKDKSLKGEDKIIEICKREFATKYINAIGGRQLYHSNVFAANNIKLCFLQRRDIRYRQADEIFVPDLSIVDVMMYNSPKDISYPLNEYDLLTE